MRAPGTAEVGASVEGMFGSAGQRALEGRLAEVIAGRTVLSQQIANVDTPGYAGGDVPSFQATLASAVAAQLGGQLPGTAGGTVPLVAAAGGAAPALVSLSSSSGGGGTLTPDGNGMDFDALMVNLAKTDLDYQSTTRQLQLTYTNLTTAIDLGR